MAGGGLAWLLAGLVAAPNWNQDQLLAAWEFDDALGGWVAEHNLRPLELRDGALVTQATGDDSYLSVGGLDLDADAISHVTVRMRSDRAGACQFYFVTTAGPNPATNGVPIFTCPGDNQWRVFTVRLTGARGWAGRLRMLRLDPVNGPGVDASIEVDFIRLFRLAPKLGHVSLGADRAWVRAGEPVTIRWRLANVGGGELPPVSVALSRLTATGEEPVAGPAEARAAVDGQVAEWTVTPREEPLEGYVARAAVGGRPAAEAELALLTCPPAALPQPLGRRRVARAGAAWVVENGAASLAVVRGASGHLAGVLRGKVGGGWRIAGVCLPLVECVTEVERRPVVRLLSAAPRIDGGALVLAGDGLSARLTAGDGPTGLAFELRATPRAPLLRLAGPTLLVGEGAGGALKAGAIFPGIEYLGAGQPSSDALAVGEAHGYRPAPPPYQITVPVMAVEQGGLLSGILWDALQRWDGEHPLPTAEFASPNFLAGQANHHLALFTPNTETGLGANQRHAGQPFEPGERPLELRCRLLAAGGKRTVDAVPLWFETFGQPAPPKLAKPLPAVLDDLVRGWAETCYDPDLDGFVNHWRFGQAPTPNADLKAAILVHAWATGERRWLERCKLTWETSLGALLPPLIDSFGAVGPAEPIASQRDDGTWGYQVTEPIAETCRQFTNGARSDLGLEGSTCVGLCAVQAVRILSQAVVHGDRASIRAGLKALAAMDQFDVPVGSQTWEVHKDIPDVYASAVATDCYRLGYELTGDRRYLERALFWARTGLPFHYAYEVPGTGPGAIVNVPGDGRTDGADPFEGPHPAGEAYQNPDRHPTPYGSIPVFGTSFYAVSWFGNLVQWCGLRWAASTLELLRHVDDPMLRLAAEGVTISGCNQTFDQPPIVGLLPDTYHLGNNMIHPAFIGPGVVEAPVRLLLGRPSPSRLETRILDPVDRPVRLTVRGSIEQAGLRGGTLRWRARGIAGQPLDAVVLGFGEPSRITVDGRLLPPVADPAAAGQGWCLREGRLYLRAVASRGPSTLVAETSGTRRP